MIKQYTIQGKGYFTYITKDTEEARALEHLYNEWKKTNMDYNSRQFAILKLFALGLDDFGTMGWEA